MIALKHSPIRRAIPFLIAVCFVSLPAYAKYSGGSGTADNPYQIATAADLIALGETPEDYDKHFLLTADIDLDPNLPGGKVFDKAVVARATWEGLSPGWRSLRGSPFTGVFDGAGHVISHLTIQGKEYLGLFGQLSGADVKNLGVVDLNITGSGGSVGGLVGWNNGGTVTQCYSTGAVSGVDRVGGLVGSNSYGTVTQCYGTGAVIGTSYVGGLVGSNNGAVTDCYSTGAVSGGSFVGGLAGENADFVTACYSRGAVCGNGYYVGGLVGWNWGSITTSYSDGSVTGTMSVGGLVGNNNRSGSVTRCYSTGTVSGGGSIWNGGVGGLVGENVPNALVSECYSTGAVSANEAVGGLVGSNGGTVSRCYSIGPVTGSGQYIGGLLGYPSAPGTILMPPMQYPGNVSNSFWDTQTSAQTTSAGGTGKTTAQMHDPNTFMAAGWDFVGQADGAQDIWAEPEGGGYPILYWQLPPEFGLPRFSGGAGEPNDPYTISTAEQLNCIGHNPRLMKCHLKLVADLDLTGFHFYPIGDQEFPYGGIFDGNGHTISDLTINGGSHVGLFGQLASGAEVRDLGVVDVNITGAGDYAGGLVGSNGSWNSPGSRVTRCYSSGAVNGSGYYVGGLVGNNFGTVSQCYGTGTVSGTGVGVGGLVGINGGAVTQCYSTGSVSGKGAVGGLVGSNLQGDVDRIVTACFWDTQTSGQATSAGGTGKTTAEMQTAKTFLAAGWDFVGETKNGTEDIWWILEGKDYPCLWWEAHN